MPTAAGYSRFLTIRKPDTMQLPDFRRLCVELQCRGDSPDAAHAGRSGGAGPAEGQTIIIGGRYLNVPTTSWYVLLRRTVSKIMTAHGVFSRKRIILLIFLFPGGLIFIIRFHLAGLPLQQVALLHGSDCFASTVYQDCLYWNTPLQCRFCGIGLSLQNKTTIRTKDPDDLASAAAYAQQHDAARHVTLTAGAWPDEDRGLEHLCSLHS